MLNGKLAERSGLEQSLRENYPGFSIMTREQQEKIIMERMGTDEEQKRRNFAELFRMAIDGSLTDELINWNWAYGKIASDDKERLKEYPAKFERQQKALITYTAKELSEQLRTLKIPGKDRALYENLADNAVRFLDPHASNFNEAVQKAYNTALSSAISAASERFSTKGFWGSPTPFGSRVQQAITNMDNFTLPQVTPEILYQPLDGGDIQTISQSGDVQPFSNTIPLPPEPEPVQESPDVYLQDIPQEFYSPYYPQKKKGILSIT